MRALLAVTLALLCGPLASARAQAPTIRLESPIPDEEPPPAGETNLFEQGLALFKQRRFADAAAAFERARRAQPADEELLLLLGISCYRTDDLARAQPLLTAAAKSGDPEVRGSARLFLGMLYERQGAADRARTELLSAAESQALGASARGLVQSLAPHRLHGSFLLSPEFDGNVKNEPAGSSDGDILFVGNLTLRPLRRVGLTLGDSLAYRQQFRILDYSLLLNSAFVGYAYLGDRHRMRANVSFNLAMLGGSLLYLQGGGFASYRLRLWSQIGLALSYTSYYRGYRNPDFAPYTGYTHIAQADLNWGLAPDPVTAALGYQGQREELAPGAPDTDFRAWAHGPYLRLRARPHRRLELLLVGTALFRRFDQMPADTAADLRRDFNLTGDVSLTVDLTRWLDAFIGATIIYNQSNRSDFEYVKPGAYLGLSATFAVL